MEEKAPEKRRRGRPPKNPEKYNDTREALIRAGLEILTEKGFVTSSIDEVLKMVSVPKGSYYHYFKSKEQFGKELLDRYITYFAGRLERCLKDEELSPLARIRAFASDAARGMEKYGYKRGCLVGTMGQEITVLSEDFRKQLQGGFKSWQNLLEECLQKAREAGEIKAGSDCPALAFVFWTGWEGAVMRAKLEQSSEPLLLYADFYLAGITCE